MPSSCSALVRCPIEGIVLLTGVIENVPRPHWEGAHPQCPSTATACVCEADVGLGLAVAETKCAYKQQRFSAPLSPMRPPTLLGIGGFVPVLINRALRRVPPPPGAFPSRSDRLPAAGTCLEDVAVG